MTLDPVSLALGFVSAYVFSTVLVAVMCIAESRAARKERDRALDQLLSDVAIRCIERPTDVPINVRMN